MSPVERIALLGPEGRGMGIVTLPARPRPDAPALVFMNAGVVHRIGPHRINVKLARALAEDGITSIRIDLSGLGDSPAPPGASNSGAQAIRDLQAAMDHLRETLGFHRFMVFGLCSGAVNGYRLALVDDRVVGLVMFDGYSYPTWKTHVIRRVARFHALPWSALLRKAVDKLRGRKPPPREQDEGAVDDHLGIPTRAKFAQTMDELVRRGTALYLVYSGSFIETYNYQAQLRDAFGGAAFLARARYDFMPDVDHTVTTIAAQRKVLAAIRDWVLQDVCARPSPVRPAAEAARAGSGASTGSSIQESLSPP